MNRSGSLVILLFTVVKLCSPLSARGGESQSTNEVRRIAVNVGSNVHGELEGGLVVTSDSFSAGEIDQIARRYAKAEKAQFDFGKTHAQIRIPRSSNYMAEVWYVKGPGQPALLCRLDFNGKVVKFAFETVVQKDDNLPPVLLGVDEARVRLGLRAETSNAMTPARADQIVRAFVHNQKINFDFTDVHFTGMSIPRTRSYLADVFYDKGFGKPALTCKLDFDGNVVESRVLTMVEGDFQGAEGQDRRLNQRERH